MSTLDEVRKILSEIEQNLPQKQTIEHKLSTDEVVAALLGRVIESESSVQLNQTMSEPEKLEYVVEQHFIEDVHVGYNSQLSKKKFLGGLIRFLQRIIRRLLKFLIAPIIAKQNSINARMVEIQNETFSRMVAEVRRIERKFSSTISQIEENMVKISENSASININTSRIAAQEVAIEKNRHQAGENLLRIKSNEMRIDNHAIELSEKGKQLAENILQLRERERERDENQAKIKLIEETMIALKANQNKKVDELELNFFRALENTKVKSAIAPQPEVDVEESDLDYFDFSNKFRGSRDGIKKNLEFYLKYLENRKNVVDLGCGRGELLELLSENKISAIGVDLSEEFVKYCNFKNFKAVLADAVEYIASLEENSVDAITGIQIIEHLSPNKLLQLCNETYKKLCEGGVMIFETPNPRSLSMFTNAFYLDPTHHTPIHPHYMKYIAEQSGFSQVEIIYTESSKTDYRLPLLDSPAANLESFNNGINLLSEVIFGSQDYAVIAVK